MAASFVIRSRPVVCSGGTNHILRGTDGAGRFRTFVSGPTTRSFRRGFGAILSTRVCRNLGPPAR